MRTFLRKKTFTSSKNEYKVIYRVAEIDPDADLSSIADEDYSYGSSVTYDDAIYTPSYKTNVSTTTSYNGAERILYAPDETIDGDIAHVTITNSLTDTLGTSFRLGVTKKFANDDWPDGDAYSFTASMRLVKIQNVDSDYQSYVKPISSNEVVTLTKSEPTAYFDELVFPYSASKYLQTGKDNIKYYFEVTETNSSIEGISYDENLYYLCVQVMYQTGKASVEKVLYYYGSDTVEDSSLGYDKCDKTLTADSDSSYMLTFTNSVSGSGNLRIHKMVVNDFGADFVRNNTGSALLRNVVFRITNNATGNYIVLPGFISSRASTVSGAAVEYDGTTHEKTGKSYSVAYNLNAQWTLINIPMGTYTVDEVADGLTLSYDASTNKVSAIENSGYSRVTKYDLTVDDEYSTTAVDSGGNNYRRVFSRDLDNHWDKGPGNVLVGDSDTGNDSHTETVQICNYYSTPLAPISVNKCYSGGDWGDDEVFTFTVSAVDAYDTYLSDGVNAVHIDKDDIPMPENTTVTVSKKDATLSSNGSYYAGANFGYIYYTYEGTYVYKVTETAGDNESINYDSNEYYIYVTVSKQYTSFSKDYKTKNVRGFNQDYYDSADWSAGAYSYSSDGEIITTTEDFYYLGADEVYKDSAGNTLAECSLRLGENPTTASIQTNPYIFSYSSGTVLTFYNSYSPGAIRVTKVNGGSSLISSDETFYFRVYDLTLGKYVKVSGTYISSDGSESEYTTALDRNPIKLGDSVLITAYYDSSAKTVKNLVTGHQYKIVELSDFDTKSEGAPPGYSVTYKVDGEAVDEAVITLSTAASTAEVIISNTRIASLSVNKVWLDYEGNDASSEHTSPLTIQILRKTASDSDWERYVTTSLGSTNDWKATLSVPPTDENGNAYYYCVREDDDYSKSYSITYSYDGETYNADADYKMTSDSSGRIYGTVTITNRSVTSYVLPSTGGSGIKIFYLVGALLILAAASFFILKRKGSR